jgi:hypothetical protein
MATDKRKPWQRNLKCKAKWVRFSLDGILTQETASMHRHANTAMSSCVQLSKETAGFEVDWPATFESYGFKTG